MIILAFTVVISNALFIALTLKKLAQLDDRLTSIEDLLFDAIIVDEDEYEEEAS